MKRIIPIITLCCGLLLLPKQSFGITTTIDFRSSAFNAAFGAPSFTHTVLDGLTLTLAPAGSGTALWQDRIDGIGVRNPGYDEADEIEFLEQLHLTFSEQVQLNSMGIADLFIERGRIETGRYSLDRGATWSTFSATQGGGNGERSVGLGAIQGDSLWLAGTGRLDNHEFALQSLNIAYTPPPPPFIPPPVVPPPVVVVPPVVVPPPVVPPPVVDPPPGTNLPGEPIPEPATMLLLACGCLGGAIKRRRAAAIQ